LRPLAVGAIVIGLLGVEASARAEGPGIRLGEQLVLHPGLAVGAGYDTNVFFASGQGSDATTGAGYIDVRPAIDLATRPAQRGGDTPHALDFRLHLGSSLRFLLSSDSNIYNHYSVNLDGGLVLSILPFGNYGLDIFDN
jgi:hypothetical protein